jgi:hypothetical protein
VTALQAGDIAQIFDESDSKLDLESEVETDCRNSVYSRACAESSFFHLMSKEMAKDAAAARQIAPARNLNEIECRKSMDVT